MRESLLVVCLLTLSFSSPLLADASTPAAPEQSNRVQVLPHGIQVDNTRHAVLFDDSGMHVQAKQGPTWRWRLTYAGPESGESWMAPPRTVTPQWSRPGAIDYKRGNVIERYLLKQRSLEQQFVIRQPPEFGDSDFIVKGAVETDGKLESSKASAKGWIWRGPDGVISLGQVTVFDAKGVHLPASMTVSQNSTLIRVEAAALADATYPVTIDPEIGTDDFRISNLSNLAFDAGESAIAYNATADHYAVVWWGDNFQTMDNNFAIFLQLLDGSDGSEVATESIIGSNGLAGQRAPRFPDIVWNATDNRYFVVWRADDGSGVPDPKEIYGQFVDSVGDEVGDDDFQISEIANVGTDRDAGFPAVAWNSRDNEYLVVWEGDGAATNGDREIFGQLIAADGTVLMNDFQISQQGTPNADDEKAGSPDVAYNPMTNEYLVVWEGDTAAGAGETPEIFGQVLGAAGGVVRDDFRITQSGGAVFAARAPSVAANVNTSEYLVAWSGDHSALGGDDVFGIHAQRLDAAGDTLEPPFRVSNNTLASFVPPPRPGIVFNPFNAEYFITWPGSVMAERRAADGSAAAEDDFALSPHDVLGASPESLPYVAVAHNTRNNEYLTTWAADSNGNGQTIVYGQRFSVPAALRFSNASPSVDETDSDIVLEVVRAGGLTDQVTVDVASSDGTAMAPADYTTVSETLSFGANETTQLFTVTITDDTEEEGNETVNLTLSNPTGGASVVPANSIVVLTLIDDETAPDDDDSGGGGGGGSAFGLWQLVLLWSVVLWRRSLGRARRPTR